MPVLVEDGDPSGVEGAEVGVLEELDDERLGGLLEGAYGVGLPAEVRLADLFANLPHQALEGALAEEEVGGLLVLADLLEGLAAGPVALGA